MALLEHLQYGAEIQKLKEICQVTKHTRYKCQIKFSTDVSSGMIISEKLEIWCVQFLAGYSEMF